MRARPSPRQPPTAELAIALLSQHSADLAIAPPLLNREFILGETAWASRLVLLLADLVAAPWAIERLE
jgi:hypothetical protein